MSIVAFTDLGNVPLCLLHQTCSALHLKFLYLLSSLTSSGQHSDWQNFPELKFPKNALCLFLQPRVCGLFLLMLPSLPSSDTRADTHVKRKMLVLDLRGGGGNILCHRLEEAFRLQATLPTPLWRQSNAVATPQARRSLRLPSRRFFLSFKSNRPDIDCFIFKPG